MVFDDQTKTSSFHVLDVLFLLRMLITRQIISMDQEHAKFVLATGFQYFWRGNGQKERMLVICFFFSFPFPLPDDVTLTPNKYLGSCF